MIPDRRSQRSPILLVEDDFESAQAMGAALESAGYPVRWARTGEEGLELLLLERRRSVVLLDLMLPDMTGVQFARRLPSYHARPPLILISGSPPQVLSEAAAALQPMVALRKPVELADLLSWVDLAWRETKAG